MNVMIDTNIALDDILNRMQISVGRIFRPTGFINNRRCFLMKQKYVPINKQSKRKQKEYHEARRKDWGNVNPVTRAVPNLKAYNRKKSKQRYEYEPCLDFFMQPVSSAFSACSAALEKYGCR